MNFLTLVALLTLTLTDPSGDAIGGGSLEPPTSPIYANTAQFDLLGVELHTPEAAGAVVGSLDANGVDADDLDPDSLAAGRPADGRPAAGTASRLTISLGSLPARRNSLDEIDQEEAAPTSDATDGAQAPLREAAAAGDLDDDGPVVEEDFDLSALLTVIDVYIGVAGGSSDVGAVSGLDRTLDGPNMLMPLGQGWRHAVRVSADGAMAITYVDPPAPTGEEHPEARLIVEPLGVTRRGNDLIMELPWRIEGDVDLYALSGVHDPFSASGWRQLSSQPSPWAFSGDGQVPPVIDLIAPDAAAQSAALASGVLPRPPKPEVGFTLPRTPWPYLMLGGLLLAVVGLVMRGRVPAPKEAADAEVGDEADATSSDAESDAELTAPVADDGDAAAPGGVAAETPATETLAAQTTATQTPTTEGAASENPVPDEEAPDQLSADDHRSEEPVTSEDAAVVNQHAADEVTVIIGDDVTGTDEPSPTPPPLVVDSAPAAPERSAAPERKLVDAEVEGSYLGSTASGFDPEDADDDDLSESFWHPRSRKPTLTGLKVPSDDSPGSD